MYETTFLWKRVEVVQRIGHAAEKCTSAVLLFCQISRRRPSQIPPRKTFYGSTSISKRVAGIVIVSANVTPPFQPSPLLSPGDDSPLKDPPRDRALTTALAKVATPRKQIVLVLVSDGYHDLLANFLHFASKHDLSRHTLVAALDAPSVALLKRPSGVTAWVDLTDHEFRGEGVPPFDPADSEGSLKVLRLSLMRRCLVQGYRVLNSDLDVVWLKNPFQAAYFSDELDFWIQSDSHTGFVETTKGGLREVFVSAGLSYAVPSVRTVRFLGAAQHMAREHPELTEQQILRLSLTVNRYRLRWRALEPALFPNGFLYWEQTFPQSLGIQPIAVHNNMAESKAAKVYRFREAGFWSADEGLSPEAFRTGGKKYLAYLGMVFDNGLGNRRVELRQALAISEVRPAETYEAWQNLWLRLYVK